MSSPRPGTSSPAPSRSNPVGYDSSTPRTTPQPYSGWSSGSASPGGPGAERISTPGYQPSRPIQVDLGGNRPAPPDAVGGRSGASPQPWYQPKPRTLKPVDGTNRPRTDLKDVYRPDLGTGTGARYKPDAPVVRDRIGERYSERYGKDVLRGQPVGTPGNVPVRDVTPGVGADRGGARGAYDTGRPRPGTGAGAAPGRSGPGDVVGAGRPDAPRRGNAPVSDLAGERYPTPGRESGLQPRQPAASTPRSAFTPVRVAPTPGARTGTVPQPRLNNVYRYPIGGSGGGYHGGGYYGGGYYGGYGWKGCYWPSYSFCFGWGAGWGCYSWPYYWSCYWPWTYSNWCYGWSWNWCTPYYYRPSWWWPGWAYDPIDWWGGYGSVQYVTLPASTVVIQETVQDEAPATEVIRTPEPAPRGEAGEAPPAKPTKEQLARRAVSMGDFYFQEERFAEAAESYLEALKHAPEDASLHLVAADALFATGDYHYAAFMIRRAIDLDPGVARAKADKRKFYRRPSVFDDQLETLRRYVKEKPYDAAAMLVLACNLRFSEQTAEARLAFQRVMEIDPGSLIAKVFLSAMDASDAATRPGPEPKPGTETKPGEAR